MIKLEFKKVKIIDDYSVVWKFKVKDMVLSPSILHHDDFWFLSWKPDVKYNSLDSLIIDNNIEIEDMKIFESIKYAKVIQVLNS